MFRDVRITSTRASLSFLRALMKDACAGSYVRELRVMITFTRSHDESICKGVCRPQVQPLEQYDPVSAEQLVQSDPTAAKLLQSGTIQLPVLVLMLAMQLCPCLAILWIPDIVLQMQHFPESKRLDGSRLQKLQVMGIRQIRTARVKESKSPLAWIPLFKRSRQQKSLHSLWTSSNFEAHVPEPVHRHQIPTSKWRPLAMNLTELRLSAISEKDLVPLLEPCHNLSVLALSHGAVPLTDVVPILAKIDSITASLEALELHSDFAHSLCKDCKSLFASLAKFGRLRTLLMPMPWDKVDQEPSLELPVTLEGLYLTWTTIKGNSHWQHSFPSLLSNAIKARQMPTNLKTIAFGWEVAEVENGIFTVLSSSLDQTYLAAALPVLEETCDAKDISFMHFSVDEADVVRKDLRTTKKILAMISGAKIMGM